MGQNPRRCLGFGIVDDLRLWRSIWALLEEMDGFGNLGVFDVMDIDSRGVH